MISTSKTEDFNCNINCQIYLKQLGSLVLYISLLFPQRAKIATEDEVRKEIRLLKDMLTKGSV